MSRAWVTRTAPSSKPQHHTQKTHTTPNGRPPRAASSGAARIRTWAARCASVRRPVSWWWAPSPIRRMARTASSSVTAIATNSTTIISSRCNGPASPSPGDRRTAAASKRSSSTIIPGSSPASSIRNSSPRHATAIPCSPVSSAPRVHSAPLGDRFMKLCHFEAGLNHPLFLIAGPSVIESESLALETAGMLKEITAKLGIPFIYKSSFDKANRTSVASFRGPGLEGGLKILEKVKQQIQVSVLTDVHEATPLREVAAVVDVLQTPAFLCRQTKFIQNVARQGRPVNIKKGQFLAPWDMKHVSEKAKAVGNEQIMVCERGVSFGYNILVSDMRALAVMRDTGCPEEFDATLSVQLPGGAGGKSGGQREFVPVLARAAVASGVAGLFMETHPNPDQALSDGPNAWPLGRMADLLAVLKELDQCVKARSFAELG